MRKSNEVNKVFVGMSKESANVLMTETCVKCKHLIDDHLRPALKHKKNGEIDWSSQDGIPYTCRDCGCEIE